MLRPSLFGVNQPVFDVHPFETAARADCRLQAHQWPTANNKRDFCSEGAADWLSAAAMIAKCFCCKIASTQCFGRCHSTMPRASPRARVSCNMRAHRAHSTIIRNTVVLRHGQQSSGLVPRCGSASGELTSSSCLNCAQARASVSEHAVSC